jgi:hypothetical protein
MKSPIYFRNDEPEAVDVAHLGPSTTSRAFKFLRGRGGTYASLITPTLSAHSSVASGWFFKSAVHGDDDRGRQLRRPLRSFQHGAPPSLNGKGWNKPIEPQFEPDSDSCLPLQ